MDTIPRVPIVDTGPLFDFLWLRYCEDYHRRDLLSGLRYLTSSDLREAIRWYFGIAKPILTCPQVIAEVHNHAMKRLGNDKLQEFWKIAHKELIELELDEDLVRLLEMDSEILCTFGPTDTALISMAVRRQMSHPVLTMDGKVIGHCRRKEIKVLSLGEIIHLKQQLGSKS